MKLEFLANSIYWAIVISLASYVFGDVLKRKFKIAVMNPILISVALTSVFLLATGSDYSQYKANSSLLSWLLTPATICLAIPLYEQLSVLKKNGLAIIVGIASGVLTSFLCILALALLFSLGHSEYVTLLPKSITTAIGIGLSEQNGGHVSITAVVIIMSGIVGNVASPFVLKILKITDPVAKGVAIGTSSHAIGTAKALEMGKVEGAVSSLCIVVAGIMTVIKVLLVRTII
ncbi:MAG TPA: LrgB family protein [Bacteroidales bacterium]|jgi:putative effector of murein hydrolase|nr:LrgB family protein [Sphaerochaeta sp.]HQB52644.1 LrgB family protein [Bacteroidales bacterium]